MRVINSTAIPSRFPVLYFQNNYRYLQILRGNLQCLICPIVFRGLVENGDKYNIQYSGIRFFARNLRKRDGFFKLNHFSLTFKKKIKILSLKIAPFKDS